MNFRENFIDHYADLYCFARRMLGSHANAEDVTQEAMLRFVRNKAGELEGISCRKWLFVVVRNLCISQLRHKASRVEFSLDECAEACSCFTTPSDSALSNERAVQVENAIAGLSPDMREVIILREYESMNYEEISGIIGCPVGTVRSRLARARSELQRRMKPFMEEKI